MMIIIIITAQAKAASGEICKLQHSLGGGCFEFQNQHLISGAVQTFPSPKKAARKS